MRAVTDASSAVLRDDVDYIRRLSAEELHARYTPRHLTLLMIAAAAGAGRVAKYLLDVDPQVNATSDDSKTALMFASERHRPSVVRMLLEAGAAPNARDDVGSTPLVLALNGANSIDELEEVVRLLVAAGADPVLANNFGATAFAAAEKIRRTWRVPLLRLSMSFPSARTSRRLLRILQGIAVT